MRQLLGHSPPTLDYGEEWKTKKRTKGRVGFHCELVLTRAKRIVGGTDRLGNCWLFWPPRYTLRWFGLSKAHGAGENRTKISEREVNLLFDLLRQGF
jgi:hypothetical protein